MKILNYIILCIILFQTANSKTIINSNGRHVGGITFDTTNIEVIIGAKGGNFKKEMNLIAFGDGLLKIKFSDSLEEPSLMLNEFGLGGWSKEKGIIHEWYNIKNGFEWEIIFDSMPDTNIFAFQFESKGLDFFYQDTLSDEEKIEGGYRPDSVVSSYAIYHKMKKDNHIRVMGQDTIYENYYTGKAFHIYRPRVIDANGQLSWAKIYIDTISSIIVLTIDKLFIQNAQYPIRLDPTFGYTGAGASSTSATDARANIADIITATSGDVITSYSAYLSENTTQASVSGALIAYSMIDTSTFKIPRIRLTSIVSISVIGAIPTWYTTTTVSHSLTNGTSYCVAAGDFSNNIPADRANVKVYYDAGATPSNSNNTNGTLDATWVSTAISTHRYSLYATYTAGGGTPTNLSIYRKRKILK